MDPKLKSDNTGLGLGSPYLEVHVTMEEMLAIENKSMEIYNQNGQTLFEQRDNTGRPTGNYTFFVVFK